MDYSLEKYPVASAVFFRSYSRPNTENEYESWKEAITRAINGIVELGKLSKKEADLMLEKALDCKALPSGRWMWCGGSEWVAKQENYYGSYNCTSNELDDTRVFGWLMNLAMQGCGTGAILEHRCISQLPTIKTHINLTVSGEFRETDGDADTTKVYDSDTHTLRVTVGDSRQGWVDAYQSILDTAFYYEKSPSINIDVDISNVRQAGKKLKGFGGTSNPIKLPDLFPRVVEITNGAIGRQLTAEECCLIVDEAALVVVAGNIRRCLPEDALVHTQRGLVEIKDIQIGDMAQTPLGFKRVTNKYDNGIRSVVTMQTSINQSVRATYNHRYAVANDGKIKWKHLYELETDDKLVHTYSVLDGGVQTYLPSGEPVTDDIAWLIGYAQSRRDVEKYREDKQTFINVINSLVHIGDMNLTKDFIDYLYRQSHVNIREVPDFILQATSDIRHDYFVGLTKLKQTNRTIKCANSEEKWIRQVNTLIASLGMIPQTIEGENSCSLITVLNVNRDKEIKELTDGLFEHHQFPITYRKQLKTNYIQTYDITVEDAHCFYCDGYLTHNSAAIKQFDKEQPQLKLNLWSQDDDGKWRIDPKKDALRMSNHTRCFHKKPTLQECVDAVKLQFECGEGAIQYVNEAIARANADLFSSRDEQLKFINHLDNGLGKQYLSDVVGIDDERELDHRINRYGLNPCFRGDMRLLTTEGYKRFDELDGTEPRIINPLGQAVKSKVWCSGEKETIKLTFSNRQEVFCTPDHVFNVDAKEVEAKDMLGKTVKQFGDDGENVTCVSIELDGIHKVYDFTEPLTHWGIVEGFVVHNCGK